MNKTEMPTKLRLEELRNEGVVPFSSFAVLCASTLGLLLALYAQSDIWVEVLRGYIDQLKAGPQGAEIDYGSVLILTGRSLVMITATALVAAVSGLACGLLQTGFLVRLSKLTPDFSRLKPGAIAMRRSAGEHLFSFMINMLLCVSGVLLGMLSLWLLFKDLTVLLSRDMEFVLKQAGELISLALPLALIVLVVAGIISWLLGKMVFLRRHRMTRREVEREE